MHKLAIVSFGSIEPDLKQLKKHSKNKTSNAFIKHQQINKYVRYKKY